jgi:hypothetical protein
MKRRALRRARASDKPVWVDRKDEIRAFPSEFTRQKQAESLQRKLRQNKEEHIGHSYPEVDPAEGMP